MGRTAIEIDDQLVERVMRRYRPPSKSATVDLALRRVAGEPPLRRGSRPAGGGRSARRRRA